MGGLGMKSSLVVVFVLSMALSAPALAQQVTAEQAVRFVDKDGDGKCSLDEYLLFQVGRLAQFDADGDGVLKYGEFKESLQGRSKQNAQRSYDAFNQEERKNALTQREFLGY